MCIRDRCTEKWAELQELAQPVESLEEGPGCSLAVRRIRQRMQHLIHRLQNLQAQVSEPPYNIPPPYNISEIIQEITSTLQGSPPVRAVSYTHLDVYKRQLITVPDRCRYLSAR